MSSSYSVGYLLRDSWCVSRYSVASFEDAENGTLQIVLSVRDNATHFFRKTTGACMLEWINAWGWSDATLHVCACRVASRREWREADMGVPRGHRSGVGGLGARVPTRRSSATLRNLRERPLEGGMLLCWERGDPAWHELVQREYNYFAVVWCS